MILADRPPLQPPPPQVKDEQCHALNGHSARLLDQEDSRREEGNGALPTASPPPPWFGTCDRDPLSLRRVDLNRYPAIARADVDRAERLYGHHARRWVVRDNVLHARNGAADATVGVASFVEEMLVRHLLNAARVPDVDLVFNCADHPVVHSRSDEDDAPVVSMCGSTAGHRDILAPTYVLALAVLGRTRVDEAAAAPWE